MLELSNPLELFHVIEHDVGVIYTAPSYELALSYLIKRLKSEHFEHSVDLSRSRRLKFFTIDRSMFAFPENK